MLQPALLLKHHLVGTMSSICTTQLEQVSTLQRHLHVHGTPCTHVAMHIPGVKISSEGAGNDRNEMTLEDVITASLQTRGGQNFQVLRRVAAYLEDHAHALRGQVDGRCADQQRLDHVLIQHVGHGALRIITPT